MPRKRERFERSDVPRDNPHRNLIGLGVILIVAVLGFAFVSALWERVQVESRMGDAALVEALDEQAGSEVLEGSFTYTENPIEKILFLQVDDPDAEHPQLISAQLLLLDAEGEAAHLVDVPSYILLSVDGSSYALGEFFDEFGPSAAIPLIMTAYNIYGHHVIMGTESPWTAIAALDGMQPRDVVRDAESFVHSMRTDLDASELVAHASVFLQLGVPDLEVEATPVVGGAPAEDEEQPAPTSVDLVPFGVQTGILIPSE